MRCNLFSRGDDSNQSSIAEVLLQSTNGRSFQLVLKIHFQVKGHRYLRTHLTHFSFRVRDARPSRNLFSRCPGDPGPLR
jgi:hypothetical protein